MMHENEFQQDGPANRLVSKANRPYVRKDISSRFAV
jgi:hypothetical protein